jgi:hypothetical protein
MMLLLGRFTYTERGILDRTHSRLFTPYDFRVLFKENSFRIRRQRSCPIPFEQIFSSYPRVAESLTDIYMLAVKVWPSLFAFQIVLEAEAVEDPIEQLRESEIMNPDYQERTFAAGRGA